MARVKQTPRPATISKCPRQIPIPTMTAKCTRVPSLPRDDEDSCKGSSISEEGTDEEEGMDEEEGTNEEEGTGEEEGTDFGDDELTGTQVSRILHLIHYYN